MATTTGSVAIDRGSTLYYWLYPLLLALPSTIGSTLYYWLYSLPSPAIHYLPKTLRYQ